MARLWTLGHGDCLAGSLRARQPGWQRRQLVGGDKTESLGRTREKGHLHKQLWECGQPFPTGRMEMVDGGAVLLRGRAAAETRDSPS